MKYEKLAECFASHFVEFDTMSVKEFDVILNDCKDSDDEIGD